MAASRHSPDGCFATSSLPSVYETRICAHFGAFAAVSDRRKLATRDYRPLDAILRGCPRRFCSVCVAHLAIVQADLPGALAALHSPRGGGNTYPQRVFQVACRRQDAFSRRITTESEHGYCAPRFFGSRCSCIFSSSDNLCEYIVCSWCRRSHSFAAHCGKDTSVVRVRCVAQCHAARPDSLLDVSSRPQASARRWLRCCVTREPATETPQNCKEASWCTSICPRAHDGRV